MGQYEKLNGDCHIYQERMSEGEHFILGRALLFVLIFKIRDLERDGLLCVGSTINVISRVCFCDCWA